MRPRVINTLTLARCSVSNSSPSRSPPRALVRRTAATERVDGSSDSRSRFVIDRRPRERPTASPSPVDRVETAIASTTRVSTPHCVPIGRPRVSYTTYETPIISTERRGGCPPLEFTDGRDAERSRHTRARDHSRANERATTRFFFSYSERRDGVQFVR